MVTHRSWLTVGVTPTGELGGRAGHVCFLLLLRYQVPAYLVASNNTNASSYGSGGQKSGASFSGLTELRTRCAFLLGSLRKNLLPGRFQPLEAAYRPSPAPEPSLRPSSPRQGSVALHYSDGDTLLSSPTFKGTRNYLGLLCITQDSA